MRLDDSVEVRFGRGEARMHVTNASLLDQFTIENALFGTDFVPATVSFDVRWMVSDEVTRIRHTENDFAGRFLTSDEPDAASVEWSASNEQGFAFASDPADTSESVFALLAKERNGAFFPMADDDD